MLLIFVIYAAYGLQFSGPVILTDEVGYLSKAIALAGHSIDAASSWHGGYSFMILPVFLLFDDPNIEWKAVMIMNAIMWSMSAGLLFYILKNFFAKKSNLTIALIVLISLLYPGFIGMTGYAYATSGFVIVLLLSIATLIKSKLINKTYLGMFCVLAGLSFWIHPMGAAYVIASVIYFISRSISEKRLAKYFIFIVILIAIPAVYSLFIHPWFNAVMTPDNGIAAVNHYDVFSVNFLSRAVKPLYWLQVAALFMGQISYLLVSTFGILAFAVAWLLQGSKRGLLNIFKTMTGEPSKTIIAIVLLSIVGAAAMEAIYFPAYIMPLRFDQWMYGRYTEMLILPAIAVGLLSAWKMKTAVWSAATAFFTGVLLQVVTNDSNTSFQLLGLGNVQSFWPLVFSSSFNYLTLFSIGSVGILFAGFVALRNKCWLMLLVVPLIILSINNQFIRHDERLGSLAGHLKISKFIVNNYQSGTCIGLDSASDIGISGEDSDEGMRRLSYYTFHLHRFDTVRMKPEYWLENCGGPYLTYDKDYFRDFKGVKVVAREVMSNLYVLVKSKDKSFGSLKYPDSDKFVYFADSKYSGCTIEGCFSWDAKAADKGSTEVGEYVDGNMRTTGKEGNLIISPKISLDTGLYNVMVSGDFKAVDYDTMISVTGENGQKKYMMAIFKQGFNDYRYAFKLSKPVKDIEIKIYVSKYADINISSYRITREF